VQRRETSLLDFVDERKKAKTSTPLMFLKGFGPDQCARMLRSNHPMGFGLGNCEEDVAKQLSSGSILMRSNHHQ